MSSYSLTRSRTFQYVGILAVFAALATGYWYFAVRAGVKTNTSGSQPQGTGDLSAGLAGYWKLDENTGTNAADASTNASTGTLTNGPTWTTGQIGSAVDFDGTNDYITDPGATAVDIRDSLSLATWVKFDSFPSSGNEVTLIRNMASNYLYDLVLYNSSGTYYLDFTPGSGASDNQAVIPVTTGTWYHVAVAFDTSSDAVNLYLDGALVGSESDGVGGGYAGGTGTLYFGSSNGTSEFLDGQMDEIRIYDRAISSDEMASMYRLTAPTGVDTSLKGYWSFNGDTVSGTTAYDRSGAGNTGTLTNGPTVTDGRIGQALQFDGTDDYVDLGVSTPYQFANTTFTATGWFKSAPSATGGVFISQGGYIPNGWYVGLNGDTSGRLTATIKNSDGGQSGRLSVQTGFNDNQWHHFAFVITTNTTSHASNSFLIYADGVLQSSTANSDSTSGGYATSTYTAKLGTRGPASDAFFNGSLDEIRVYNRALSANEIKSFYDRGSPDKTNTSAGQAAGTGTLGSGLAGYWKLDENTGTSAADSSVNGNTGTLTNGPAWTTGQIGSGIDFDGTNDYVAAADNDALDFGDGEQFTVTGWFNRDTFTTDDTIIAKSNGPLAAGYVLFVDDATDYLSFYVGDGTDYYGYVTSSNAITSSGWHHFVAAWGDSYMKLYLDGQDVGVYNEGTIGNINSLATSQTINIGTESDGQVPFDGKIDEIRIYDRVLLTDEISQLYRLTAPTGVDTSLRGYWSFNGQDISGTTVYDRSGVGNDGTLTGGPSVVEGRVGQALSYDNVDDYVLAGSPSAVDNLETQGGGGMTASAWIYPESGGTFGGSIVGKRAAPSPGDGDWSFNIHQDGDAIKFYKSHSTTNLEATTLPGSIVLNKWQFVTATWSGGSTRSSVTFYIDGVLVPTSTSGGSDGVGTKDSDAAEVISISSQFLQFDGLIDEVRLYNRILPAAEIKSLYDASAPDKANTSISTPQGTGRLDSGLAGYWKLDENTGTSAADASTNGNTGTLTNGPTWTTGQIGSAVDFDGTDDYISLGTTLVSADSITVAAWVKGDAAVDGMPIIGQINGEEGSDHQCLIYDNAGTENIIFGNGVGGSVNIQVTGTGASLGTTWHHVVYTNSGTTNSIYLDGTKLVQTVSNALTTNTESNITIGRCWSGGGASYFNGLIDDVRIYRRTLSVDEVGQLYRLGAPTGTDTGLKGYWSFNGQDLSGTTAYDRSGAGNTGTLTNGPTVTEGKIGQALSFDGSNDYVDAGSAASLDDLPDLTVSAWIRQTGVGSGFTTIAGKGYGVTPSVSGWNFLTDPLGGGDRSLGFRADFATTDLVVSSSEPIFSYNEWVHVAVTWDGTTAASNVHLYMNGVDVGSYPTQTNGSGAYSSDASETLSIGCATSGVCFPGNIDEVRVYNRILSASEIKALYSSGR